MDVIRSRAPVRIAFGGGGTDISPYDKEKGGCVLNATINRYVYVTLKKRSDKKIKIISVDYKRNFAFNDLKEITIDGDLKLVKAIIKRMNPDYGFELFLRSDIPPNTGLGSSGSVAVATIGAFNYFQKNKLNLYEIAELAFQVEDVDLQNKGGRQDQYAAAFGGLNFIEFKGGAFVRVNPIRIKKDHILELEKHLVLAFIGPRGDSGKVQEILIKQQKSYEKEEKQAVLDELKGYALQMMNYLENGSLNRFGKLIGKSWDAKKKLNPRMTTERINHIYTTAMQNGAIGGRITGAGGGGCMVFYCQANKEQVLSKKLEEIKGVKVINFSFDTDGLQVWKVNNNE